MISWSTKDRGIPIRTASGVPHSPQPQHRTVGEAAAQTGDGSVAGGRAAKGTDRCPQIAFAFWTVAGVPSAPLRRMASFPFILDPILSVQSTYQNRLAWITELKKRKVQHFSYTRASVSSLCWSYFFNNWLSATKVLGGSWQNLLQFLESFWWFLLTSL